MVYHQSILDQQIMIHPNLIVWRAGEAAEVQVETPEPDSSVYRMLFRMVIQHCQVLALSCQHQSHHSLQFLPAFLELFHRKAPNQVVSVSC
jgi:hypothetical protein